MAILLIAHTKAGINDNSNHLIDPQDIRGNKSVSNLVEFLYILQRFQVEKEYHPFIFIKKNRGYVPENPLYFCHFNRELKAYVNFSPVEFNEFKKVFKKRNKL